MSSRIVTICLWGGLCNRLFQIACCYGYAEKYNMTPVFYTKFFDKNDHTSTEETIAILKQLIPSINIQDTSLVTEKDFNILEVSGDYACKYIELKDITLDSNKCNVLLKGYFQSEKYFAKNNKFLLPYVLEYKSYTHTQAQAKYFIHVRMGDYVGHYLHNLGYKTYVKNAINYIREINKSRVITFLICSNETNKEKINAYLELDHLQDITLEYDIDINPTLSPLNTLHNMMLCGGGGVCFNSSFSWFGAYLSRLYNTSYIDTYLIEKQCFIMPNKWFNDKYISRDKYLDIYPEWKDLVILDI